jgi:hypothetical protein
MDLEKLDLEQLKKLDDEFRKGRIQELIETKAAKEEKKACAVCGREMPKNTSLILEFGDPGLRKRAHFCAYDCMDYFLGKLKD